MTWVTPLTAVANTPLDASQWNSSVRDNLLETMPAKATTASRVFVTDGTGKIAEREFAAQYVDDLETTTSGSYTDLGVIGPRATVTSGPLAIVWWSCQLGNTTTDNSLMSYGVTGATTNAAADNRALEWDGNGGIGSYDRWGVSALQTTTPGVNTFTAKYKATGGTATFRRRRINVLPL